MAKGFIHDPRMNSREKEYGILIAEELDEFGRCKEIVYLKNNVSRSLTFGSPVIFKIDKDGKISSPRGDAKAAIEVASEVVLNEEEINEHPITKNLNIFAKVLLELDEEELERLTKRTRTEDIERMLKKGIDKLLCPP
ncbi:hypothetical protein QQ020_29290 [Fulvivirgaceae bacterium BMA12]|uniref:Uncharacterized protein n=1 Tax=Agaribacillus aureus TaxID=3051825 RepID=A0ABT8LIV0_9BACT|nr:hypothetical protein [Fulvivirgaceae bacterium BMA12]